MFAIETEGPPYNVHIKMKADNEKKKAGCGGGVLLEAQCWRIGELELGRSLVLSGQPLGYLVSSKQWDLVSKKKNKTKQNTRVNIP